MGVGILTVTGTSWVPVMERTLSCDEARAQNGGEGSAGVYHGGYAVPKGKLFIFSKMPIERTTAIFINPLCSIIYSPRSYQLSTSRDGRIRLPWSH
jgi:hypothetical protein